MSSWRRPQGTAGEMAFLCWFGNASVPSGRAGGGGQLRLQSGLAEAPETGCNKKKKRKKEKRKTGYSFSSMFGRLVVLH